MKTRARANNPTNAITYPVAVPAAATAPAAVKFFNAAAGSGMGKFTITPTIGVFVPQNSYHGFENTSNAEVVMAWLYAGAASLEAAGFVTRREDGNGG